MRRRRPKTLPLLTAVAVIAAWSSGCAQKVTRALVSPADVATLDDRSPYLKAHRADGHVYVLSSWGVDPSGSVIVGEGSLLDAARSQVAQGPFEVPVDSVALFETNVVEGSGANTGITIMAGVTAAVAGVCLADPKACFGSCPTFYARGSDGEWQLQAETFSASIAPALEATDVDQLLQARATGREFRLRVTNEALETHVIRYADLLAIPRPGEGRVHRTSDGVFHTALDPTPPTSCSGPEGDCLAAVSEADGRERFSTTDSMDLATRETVLLTFDAPPDGELGLVLVTRQSLLTTFLVYQALAWMGQDAGRWLASLESADPASQARVEAMARALGDVEIQLRDDTGRWATVGHVGETGPIARDTRVVPLPATGGGPLDIRLRMTRGMWRLDAAHLVALEPAPHPVRLSPVEVRDADGGSAPEALAALTDPHRTFVTLPRDVFEISYELPEAPDGFDLFLEARGYYLEWMRREWMAEENPFEAAAMILDPERALRNLAPTFKAMEPTIEDLFWNSRYVRH